MCLGDSPDPPPPPPAPPPPPPVLEQAAPTTAAPRQAELDDRKASGTKRYRSSGLGIDGSTSTPAGGLGISM